MFELRNVKRSLSPTAAAVALFICGSLMLTGPAQVQVQAKQPEAGQPEAKQAEGKDVLVTNTSSQAVPVAVQGTPTVGLATGANAVTVANPGTAPVPTYNARDAMEPFQAFLFNGGNGNAFTVPAGKRLVIEYAGVWGQVKGGVLYSPAIRTTVGDVTQFHHLSFEQSTFVPSPGSGLTRYEGSNTVRIYADPGTRVDFIVLNEGGSNISGEVSLSGYLVPVP